MAGSSKATGQAGMTRRGFLQHSVAASLLKTAAPAAAIAVVWPRPAHAWAQAALAVVAAVAAYNNRPAGDGGLRDLFEGIRLKLDQILDNQVETLEALAVIQGSLDDLQASVRATSDSQFYLEDLRSSREIYDEARLRLREIRDSESLGHFDDMSFHQVLQGKYDSFRATVRKCANQASLFNAQVSEVSASKDGFVPMTRALRAAARFGHSLEVLAVIEQGVPEHVSRAEWSSKATFSQIHMNLIEALQMLIEMRISEAMSEQQNIANAAWEAILDGSAYWGPVVVRAFEQYPNAIPLVNDRVVYGEYICVKSPVDQVTYRGRSLTASFEVRRTLSLPLQIIMLKVPETNELIAADVVDSEWLSGYWVHPGGRNVDWRAIAREWKNVSTNEDFSEGEKNLAKGGIDECVEQKPLSPKVLGDELKTTLSWLEQHARARVYEGGLLEMKTTFGDLQERLSEFPAIAAAMREGAGAAMQPSRRT